MKPTIALYCPDEHLQYNLRTLDDIGVGGGVTARLRLAHTLAGLGCKVTAYINCPTEEIYQGVEYRHFSSVRAFSEQVFIASSSGGNLDLKTLSSIENKSILKILMVHGTDFPRHISPEYFDWIYSLSNFVRKIAILQWGVDPKKIFVFPRGVASELYESSVQTDRDPFKIVYFGHPSKGLEAAIEVLKILRSRDKRYSLHVYGGYRLWGECEQSLPDYPGLIYHGLVGQRFLAQELLTMGFSLNLQSRAEPFGMVIIESMRAGCIVLASPVGAFPEIISNGYNGFLVPGDHQAQEAWSRTADLISYLNQHTMIADSIRGNAINSPLNWDTIAKSWLEHWNWAIEENKEPVDIVNKLLAPCPECSGKWLPLPDGYHCTGCGRYERGMN